MTELEFDPEIEATIAIAYAPGHGFASGLDLMREGSMGQRLILTASSRMFVDGLDRVRRAFAERDLREYGEHPHSGPGVLSSDWAAMPVPLWVAVYEARAVIDVGSLPHAGRCWTTGTGRTHVRISGRKVRIWTRGKGRDLSRCVPADPDAYERWLGPCEGRVCVDLLPDGRTRWYSVLGDLSDTGYGMLRALRNGPRELLPSCDRCRDHLEAVQREP